LTPLLSGALNNLEIRLHDVLVDDLEQGFQLMNLQLAGPPLIAAGVLTEEDVELLRKLFADPSFYYVDSVLFGAWGRRSPD
jgi:hypothetical protein